MAVEEVDWHAPIWQIRQASRLALNYPVIVITHRLKELVVPKARAMALPLESWATTASGMLYLTMAMGGCGGPKLSAAASAIIFRLFYLFNGFGRF